MIKFDFSTYMKDKVDIDFDKKESVIGKLHQDSMAGFLSNKIEEDEISRMEEVASYIRKSSDVLIVIGIGGSFMGSYAIKNMFSSSFFPSNIELIYLGTDLSSQYVMEVLEYIKNKRVSVNVISKSGTTLEIHLLYQLIKKELSKKYTKEELQRRIIITTDKEKGRLRQEVEEEGYASFEIPSNIGGRYSLMTPAHLLPLMVLGLDIRSLLSGFHEGLKLIDDAYYYASLRVSLFHQKKYIENFSIYDKRLYYYTEWIKQLFGESEGKNGKGIFPVSTVNTRDLHSLGQFIQQGNPIVFETVINVLKEDSIKVLDNTTLAEVNQIVCDSVCRAHYQENTPSIVISIDELTMENIGILSAFLMLSAAFSAYLFDVNPFDQPGVENYKKEVKKKIQI